MSVDKALLHAMARDAQHDALVDVLGGLAERWHSAVGGSQLTLLRAHDKDVMRGDGFGQPTRCFDATLELRTSGSPLKRDVFAGLASELDAVAWVDLCALQLGKHRSFVACDPAPVRFQYCMRRRHDFSHTAYLERYAAVHSRFGLETRGIEGYSQFHIDSEASAAAAEAAGLPTSRASSVSELHLASVEAFLAEGAHNAKLGATEDEDRFVDRAAVGALDLGRGAATRIAAERLGVSPRVADFRDRYGPWALVCGASDGIGEAFAREFAAAGLHVALLARRRDRLETLAAELEAQHGIDALVVVADLTADTLVADVTSQVGPREIGSLVYVSGSPTEHVDFLDAEPDTWTRQIRLNCDGPMQLAHAFGRGMRERRRGGLLFLTSLASQAGGGRHALYCGTKAFDQLFAESLWHELSPHGVDVLSLLVGPTHTPTTDEVLGLDFSRLFPDPSFVATADEVAREGLDHLHEGPVWIPNAALRQAFPHLSPAQRAAAVEAATASNARLDGIPDYVPVWDAERGRKRVR